MSHEDIFRVTPEERELIYKIYNKTKEQINEDIQNIKNWLLKKPHLPQNEDDKKIRLMLILNKFSLEKTKKKLDLYYSVRSITPEIYTDREPLNPEISQFLNCRTYTVLPHLNKDLCRVYIFRLDECNSEQFDVTLFMKLTFSACDLRTIYDTCVGEQIIIDYGKLTLGHVVKLNVATMMQVFSVFQKAYSGKVNNLHFLNVPSIGITVINLFKGLLPDKLRKRIIIHSNIDTLYDCISKDILPYEYGGTFGHIKDIHDKWRAFQENNNTWIKEEGLRRTDESKRIGEPIDSELFGWSGSFRQLNVD